MRSYVHPHFTDEETEAQRRGPGLMSLNEESGFDDFSTSKLGQFSAITPQEKYPFSLGHRGQRKQCTGAVLAQVF